MKKYCSIYNYNNIETKKKSIDGSKVFGWVGIRALNDEQIQDI